MEKSTPTTATNSPRGRFPKYQELDNSLVITNKQICRRPKAGKNPSSTHAPTLPGHPLRSLENTIENNDTLGIFMQKEFLTPDLNHMAPHLGLLATPKHDAISPLHEQYIRGREVVITENPQLHLLWINNRVFIKPLPPYLLSHAFWERYLDSSLLSPLGTTTTESLQPAILGYMRTWTYLIVHESDFQIAKQANLIPRAASHTSFLRFISNFSAQHVTDAEVSPRYRFGQLRLRRLNFWAKFFLGRWEFEQVHWQTEEYWRAYYTPLLFVFAAFTLVLSAMQVALSAPSIWPVFASVSVWFSVVTLLLLAGTVVFFVVLFAVRNLDEGFFALKQYMKKKKRS